VTARVGTPLFVWAAVGDPNMPPERIPTECCVSCAALVPVSEFDVHGQWHREVEGTSPG